MHHLESISSEAMRWLRQVVTGYYNYHAVPTNSRALEALRYHVIDLWRCGDEARRTARRGRGSPRSPTTGSPNRASFTLGRSNALPSDTRGGSRMRECRTYGSVRGVRSNAHSYRNSLLGLRACLTISRPSVFKLPCAHCQLLLIDQEGSSMPSSPCN